MKYLIVSFCFESTVSGVLPVFKGSMLRGAFGGALKDRVCSRPGKGSCLQCFLRDNCLFFQMFSAESETQVAQKDLPRPYVFRSGCSKKSFEKGDILTAELVVFERLIVFVPLMIEVMKKAAASGFGVQRMKFELKKAVLNGRNSSAILAGSVPSDSDVTLFDVLPPLNLATSPRRNTMFEISSPLFLKNKKTGKCQIDASRLLRCVIRRISDLSRCWGDDEWSDFPFTDLFKSFEKTKIFSTDLHWVELSRYSRTQGREFPVMGYVGRFLVENVPACLLTILSMLDDVHVGKGAAWGLGRVKTVGYF